MTTPIRKPIYIITPRNEEIKDVPQQKENLVSLVTFYPANGTNEERKNALWSLMVQGDINEDGKIDFSMVNFLEQPLSKLHESFRTILKKNFSDIQDNSEVVMRFFQNKEEKEFNPVIFEQSDNTEELSK